MPKNSWTIVADGILMLAAVAVPLVAHHVFGAEFDRIKRANGRDVAFADGSKIFQGSSGTGAPYEAELLKARREKGRC